MIRSSLLVELFNTNCIQRWNDKLRPIDLVELDYQGHRMMMAYFLGKYEERKPEFQWTDVIDGGMFALLETSVLTDLRWNVKERLNRYPSRRKELDKYVLKQLEPLLLPLGHDLLNRFKHHQAPRSRSTLARRLLRAAGAHAREWEFNLLKQANPQGYEVEQIAQLMKTQDGIHELRGCNELHRHKKYQDFVDVCGELRYQGRWSHLHMSPRTSVLGHSMFVAIVSYLFSLEAGACQRQQVNNFFLGLFHDLEETQTRDVSSPLKKKVPVIAETLKEISRHMMEQELIRLLPPSWHDQFKRFSLTEPGRDSIRVNNQLINIPEEDAEKLFGEYNSDDFDPMSGSLVKAADDLSAYLESVQAFTNGSGSPEIHAARYFIAREYEEKRLGDLDLGLLYRELSS